MNDYIKISRKMLDWGWYKNEHTKNVFIHCLLKANWKDGMFEGREIKRGQFVTSVAKLSHELDLTPNEVRTALTHLKATNEITSKGYSKYTVITVVKYDLYQATPQAESQTNHELLTNKSQTINEQLTTIEERKNIKKGRNNIFVPPSVEEVAAYCAERKNQVDAQSFVDFYSAKGWMIGKNKMKDWKAAVRTWERNGADKKTNQFNNYSQSLSEDEIDEFQDMFLRENNANKG